MASRVIVLTGGPAAGKSTVAPRAAQARSRCAVIDVDDVRRMLVHPHVAPWGGEEGHRQHLLGVRNTCDLARSFQADGCDVIITDVLTPETIRLYRDGLGRLTIVQLLVSFEVAEERARSRPFWLTPEEMRTLHAEQAALTDVDHRLDSEALGVEAVAQRVASLLD